MNKEQLLPSLPPAPVLSSSGWPHEPRDWPASDAGVAWSNLRGEEGPAPEVVPSAAMHCCGSPAPGLSASLSSSLTFL